MSYDLNILVINQEFPTSIKDVAIEVIDEFSDEYYGKRYHSIWPFMTRMNGIWYSLVKNEEGVVNAFSICDSDFDTNYKELPVPPWIDDVEILEELTPLLIRQEYRKDFELIINKLVNESPDKSIMFLSRFQSPNHEIIYGALNVNEFFNLLNNKKILFNICYIITG